MLDRRPHIAGGDRRLPFEDHRRIATDLKAVVEDRASLLGQAAHHTPGAVFGHEPAREGDVRFRPARSRLDGGARPEAQERIAVQSADRLDVDVGADPALDQIGRRRLGELSPRQEIGRQGAEAELPTALGRVADVLVEGDWPSVQGHRLEQRPQPPDADELPLAHLAFDGHAGHSLEGLSQIRRRKFADPGRGRAVQDDVRRRLASQGFLDLLRQPPHDRDRLQLCGGNGRDLGGLLSLHPDPQPPVADETVPQAGALEHLVCRGAPGHLPANRSRAPRLAHGRQKGQVTARRNTELHQGATRVLGGDVENLRAILRPGGRGPAAEGDDRQSGGGDASP